MIDALERSPDLYSRDSKCSVEAKLSKKARLTAKEHTAAKTSEAPFAS